MGVLVVLVAVFLYLTFVFFILLGIWKTFAKAGQPGWASIVPIYNIYVFTQIAKKPEWWVVLFFIPFINIVIGFKLMISIAKNFGKGVGFGLGLVFFGFIFFPILGFGNAVYIDQKKLDSNPELLDA